MSAVGQLSGDECGVSEERVPHLCEDFEQPVLAMQVRVHVIDEEDAALLQRRDGGVKTTDLAACRICEDQIEGPSVSGDRFSVSDNELDPGRPSCVSRRVDKCLVRVDGQDRHVTTATESMHDPSETDADSGPQFQDVAVGGHRRSQGRKEFSNRRITRQLERVIQSPPLRRSDHWWNRLARHVAESALCRRACAPDTGGPPSPIIRSGSPRAPRQNCRSALGGHSAPTVRSSSDLENLGERSRRNGMVVPMPDAEPDPSREQIEALYDAIGDFEWLRLERDGAARVAFEIHTRFLRRHLPPGGRVLEIGAGPGRFTIELAKLECEVVVSDLSNVQLALNERHVRDAGWETSVVERRRLDVCDLSSLSTDSVDAVVAYGGPLSYVFGDAQVALRECLRVVRPDGVVLASVMSLAGSGRRFFDSFPPSVDAVGLELFDQFLSHGDQRAISAAPGVHPCQLFTWRDIQDLVPASGGEIVAASASNWLSLGSTDALDYFEAVPERWEKFLDWEERLCTEQGTIDGGTHLLFAATP